MYQNTTWTLDMCRYYLSVYAGGRIIYSALYLFLFSNGSYGSLSWSMINAIICTLIVLSYQARTYSKDMHSILCNLHYNHPYIQNHIFTYHTYILNHIHIYIYVCVCVSVSVCVCVCLCVCLYINVYILKCKIDTS